MFSSYKKIIRKRETRQKILLLLSWVPDEIMVRLQYYIKFHHILNLKNPKRLTEKLQWYKLYYKEPLMITCVDKYDVREYIKQQGFEELLNGCYGVYAKPEEIDFSSLPDKFVLKDTVGGGGNSVIVCESKEDANIQEYIRIMNTWISKGHQKTPGREWPYSSGKGHRIIIDEYIDPIDKEMGLIDYKFFCFYGKTEFMYACYNRRLGNKAKFTIMDANFNKLPVYREDEDEGEAIPKPAGFEKMREIAETLAAPFPEVRVDLYCENSRIIFGEFTFFDSSGYIPFNPDSFDVEMGEKFVLPKRMKLK